MIGNNQMLGFIDIFNRLSRLKIHDSTQPASHSNDESNHSGAANRQMHVYFSRLIANI